MKSLESIVLGGGCFWCTEAIFRELAGVEKVESGYAGGHVPFPTYNQVSSGKTGHAEVVRVTFDPKKIRLQDIVSVFFALHDPTTPNQQGADVGDQYRSVIFYENPDQKAVAEQVRNEVDASGLWPRPIVTEIQELMEFYLAEEYHQEFYERNASQPYCSVVITPKLAKLRREFGPQLAR